MSRKDIAPVFRQDVAPDVDRLVLPTEIGMDVGVNFPWKDAMVILDLSRIMYSEGLINVDVYCQAVRSVDLPIFPERIMLRLRARRRQKFPIS